MKSKKTNSKHNYLLVAGCQRQRFTIFVFDDDIKNDIGDGDVIFAAHVSFAEAKTAMDALDSGCDVSEWRGCLPNPAAAYANAAENENSETVVTCQGGTRGWDPGKNRMHEQDAFGVE